jgi:probable rRNA maturation factor
MSVRPKITVRNLNKAYRLNEPFIRKMALRALSRVKKAGSRQLNIVFVNDRAMRALNRKYKGTGRSTDVLSFRIDVPELGSGCSFGEIAICSDTAFRNAKVFKTAFEPELILYVIHAILHLSGYDDGTRRERARMDKKQNEVLKDICRNQKLSKVLTRR